MAPSLESESNTELLTGEAKEEQNVQEEEDGLVFVMQMQGYTVVAFALQTAIELGVFDIIAKAGEGAKLSAKEIAAHIGSKNPEASAMLDRILRLLVSHSVLYCSVSDDPHSPQRFYSLTPASKYFVTDDDGVSYGPAMALPLDRVFYKSWTELKGAILEGGIPFNRVYGMHAFEYPSVDPRFNEVFNKGMCNSTSVITKKILESYRGFENINTLVDVGGGLGVNLKLTTSRYPHIRGINFDLPHVVRHAPAYAGVEHVGGDMFESVPIGDAIFMKWILHDWSDEHCLKLLKNCYKAIPDDGKLIVVDSIIPFVPDTTAASRHAFTADVFMMAQNPGGKERTKQELIELATASGFSGITVICPVAALWVMEFFK